MKLEKNNEFDEEKKVTKKKVIKKSEEFEEEKKIDVDKLKSKIKSMSNDHKILICLYVLIGLNIIHIILPYIAPYKNNSNDSGSIVNTSNTEYDVSMFTEISTNNYADVVNSSDLQLIFMGRSSCTYCQAFLPILQQVQKEYGYKTNYLNIEEITSDEEINKIFRFDNEDKVIKNNFGSTPMVVVFKKGKLVNMWLGYDDYDKFVQFVEECGFTKK